MKEGVKRDKNLDNVRNEKKFKCKKNISIK